MTIRTKLIILGIVGFFAFLLALLAAYLILFSGEEPKRPVQKPPGETTTILEIWGLFDDSDIYDPVIQAFEKARPSIHVRYKKLIWDDYEQTLINALASGRGPDIFMVHNTWLSKHKDKLAPAPEKTPYPFLLSTRDAFSEGKAIYAYPLFIDNLALFYNKDVFASQGFFEEPKTWSQLGEYIKALTRFSPSGSLIRAGAAFGTSSQRINRATDILLLLMAQNGIEPIERKTGKVSWEDDQKKFEAARDALRFYTDFANPSKDVYTWNEAQDYSIDAFWEGKLAMMVNYAYNIETIRQKAPYLNFAITSLPQKGSPVTVGNYWGFGVSGISEHKKEAWQFLQFFSQDEHYLPYSKTTGRLGAKKEILESQRSDPLLKPFVDQERFMKTPFEPDEKKMQEILDEMITKVNRGELTYDQALRLAGDRLKLLIK